LTRLESLNPDTLFANARVLTKTKVREYEKNLKAEIQQWVTWDLSAQVKRVIHLLGSNMEESVEDMIRQWEATNSVDVTSQKFLSRNILNLLLSLSYQVLSLCHPFLTFL
jgi:hypothetical protein